MKKKKKEEVSASEEVEIVGEVSSCSDCKCKKISKLDVVFQNEDMNKVVEKINEIIDNDSI